MDRTDVNPAVEKSEKVYESTPVMRDEHAEGLLTRIIEQQTSKLPSDFFLWCSLGSMGLSLYLELSDCRRSSRFIGMWASPFLIMGLYDKIIKTSGSR